MAIRVQLPNGQIAEFPDGTDPADIEEALGGKSLSGFMRNVGRSGSEQLKSLVGAVTHPIETVKGAGKLALGAGELLIPGEQGYEPVARAAGEFYKKRYGSLENVGNTLYRDPVGAAMDVSTVLGGTGAALKGVGLIPKLEAAARAGSVLSTAGELTNPARAVTLPAKLAMQEAGLYPIMATTRGTKATRQDFGGGREIAKTIQQEALLTEGEGARKTAAAYGTGRREVAKARRAGVPGVRTGDIARGVRRDVQPTIEARTRVGRPDVTPELTEELRRLRAANPPEIPLDEADILRQEAQDVAYEMGKENLTVPKLTQEATARQLRGGIEQQVPTVGPMNERTQRLLGATRLMQETEPGGYTTNFVVPGLIGGGAMAGGMDPITAIKLAAASRAASSPTLGRGLGIALGAGGQLADPFLARAALLERLAAAGISEEDLGTLQLP